ncbi:MAG: hypothetical protein ACI396_01820, partial [Acutalibacteraceae bacterium]
MKRFLAIVLSLALVLSVAAIASISVSADTLGDTDIWCYVGDSSASRVYAKTAEKSTDGTAYEDGASALQAAFDDLAAGVFTVSSTSYICTNQDITLTKQVTCSVFARFKNLYTLKYEPTEADAPLTAFYFNGYSLWLYGSDSAIPANANYIGYNGNAFFENIGFQFGAKINGDISIKDCVSFNILGNKTNTEISGNLIFTGTVGNNMGLQQSLTVDGDLDVSGLENDTYKAIVESGIKNNSKLTLKGSYVTGSETGGEEEEVPTEPQTIYLDSYYATLSNCKQATDHKGYDGAGFVGDFSKADSSTITFASKYVVPATYTLDIRYAAPLGDGVVEVFDGDTSLGEVTLTKNVSIDSSCQWCYFADNQSKTYTVTGDTEKHSFKLVFKSGSAANIDSLILIPSKPTITMDTGAAMRIDGITEGIRFSAVANKSELDAFKNTGVTITDCGMIIAKQGANGAAEQNMIVEFAQESTAESVASNPNSVVAKYGNITPVSVEDANAYSLVGSLVEIKDANAKQMYVARAYIEYTVSGDS